MNKVYDVVIVGAGASGIFTAYELIKKNTNINILIIEKGNSLDKRVCPIDGNKIKTCIHCKVCNIMNGYGGAGSLSDGKYNITNNFGGELYKYVGRDNAIELMNYVDEVLCSMGGADAKLYSTSHTELKSKALQYDLHLLDAKVRHLGTDRNLVILNNIYDFLKDKVDFLFNREVIEIGKSDDEFFIKTKDELYTCRDLVIATGRSGSKWISEMCKKLKISTESNRVDIGVRVELPAAVFEHITKEVYESKIIYRTKKYSDFVRTFCMNPHGEVVNENTNGIVTVNGHSYSNPELHTDNTNFALLVSNHFTEPFKNSNEYGESIARLSNMLGGGVLVQRFGDLVQGRRTNEHRLAKSFTRPTLNATPGDLSLVLPKRQLDDIIEMIYALDKIAPGTANEDTLLYGVEVKFYNSMVEVNNDLETNIKGLYVLGDGSGVTHSLSQASASGVHVGRILAKKYN
ncbi:NAD(P)/FAD-dependent oxidoreductase [Clostridium swellfunianum]|uniref:NAD(P)/FAD-dependent oxidoreductase n=1 Tax=Clostridium swellfunianum TaxID=1367462 RepID=UPI00202DCBE8|nr:NAD(P)/FAD-dependent oxidoreductase [Clostridium swellfunianum]MCM0649214.1 NAD(P)/FAD-dependent oxidoreductase [Clostridium swellfunianum]